MVRLPPTPEMSVFAVSLASLENGHVTQTRHKDSQEIPTWPCSFTQVIDVYLLGLPWIIFDILNFINLCQLAFVLQFFIAWQIIVLKRQNLPSKACNSWIPWNLSFRYILFHEKWFQTMLWNHNAWVNSHQSLLSSLVWIDQYNEFHSSLWI